MKIKKMKSKWYGKLQIGDVKNKIMGCFKKVSKLRIPKRIPINTYKFSEGMTEL